MALNQHQPVVTGVLDHSAARAQENAASKRQDPTIEALWLNERAAEMVAPADSSHGERGPVVVAVGSLARPEVGHRNQRFEIFRLPQRAHRGDGRELSVIVAGEHPAEQWKRLDAADPAENAQRGPPDLRARVGEQFGRLGLGRVVRIVGFAEPV